MAEKTRPPYVLVPEAALLEPLPAHFRSRFEKALELMLGSLSDAMTWEEIAEKSAISPYHFHRQFTELFFETPGQYLSRLRLQVAVNMLLEEPNYKVTDIAQEAGYSSSQALAKVLKRELNITAKEIRILGNTGTLEAISNLIEKLAHPSPNRTPDTTLEKKLAEQLPCELVWYPERWVKGKVDNQFQWEAEWERRGKDATKIIMLTPVNQLENQWQDIDNIIGVKAQNRAIGDYLVPEGYYLCCDVYVVSDAGYEAAWEGLYQHSVNNNLELDEDSFCVELLREMDLSLTGGAHFSMQLPIKQ